MLFTRRRITLSERDGPVKKYRVRAQIVALPLVLAVITAIPGNAQGYPFSQRASVSQTVAFTNITIAYGRPVARGRALFGSLVPWDSVWHPGADSATRISFSRDVLIDGHALKAGEYSVWLIPRDGKPWTFIFNRKSHVFHKPYPGAAFDVLRIEIVPESATHMEALAYYFPEVLRDAATLRLQWGTTVIPIHIKAPFRPGA